MVRFRLFVIGLFALASLAGTAAELTARVVPQPDWDGTVSTTTAGDPARCSGTYPQPLIGPDPVRIMESVAQFVSGACIRVSACQTMATEPFPRPRQGNDGPNSYWDGYISYSLGKQITCQRGEGCNCLPESSWSQATNLTLTKRCNQANPGWRYDIPSRSCICAGADEVWVPEKNACKRVVQRVQTLQSHCARTPNPISILTGAKTVSTGELLRIGGLAFTAEFNSSRQLLAAAPDRTVPLPSEGHSFGPLWFSNVHRHVARQGSYYLVSRGHGHWVSFTKLEGSDWVPASGDRKDRLRVISGWRYLNAADRSQEIYDSDGRFIRIAWADGRSLSLVYSTGSTPPAIAPVADLLIELRDDRGRVARLAYEQPAEPGLVPRVRELTAPDGAITRFGYDPLGNLVSIRWPDGSQRQFLYEDTAFPRFVTGIVDETGQRHLSYAYDTEGRAIRSETPGGINRHQLAWATPARWQVVDTYDPAADVVWRDHVWTTPLGTKLTKPNGQQSVIEAANPFGRPLLATASQPAGAGCDASTSATSYDAHGFPASSDDFNGNRSCFVHDAGRGLEGTRVEGLPSGNACTSVTSAGAALPLGARKVSTQWHPEWALPVRVAEPGQIITSIYNGQPDPFAGGALALCAPSALPLPSGSRIAVLCKRVEQATSDADGSQAFAAALQAGEQQRVWQWTYDRFGQVLTATDPLGRVTTWTYYSETSPDFTVGDLQSVTNALGHTTRFTRYRADGKPLQMVDANGVVTDYAYDARSRLIAVTVGGVTTRYGYWPNGLLREVTLPDGSRVRYEYDAAHRNTAVSDHLGNRIEYQLDDAGNRIGENVKDSSGVLRQSLSRSFDALGRVQQIVGSGELR